MALTVIEPAAERMLTTLETAWNALGISSSEADAYIEQSIDQASDAICAWCKRVFAVETVRETLYPSAHGKSLMLSRWPIVSIDAVTLGGTALDPALAEVEDGGFIYRLDVSGCRVGWPAGKIVVEYRAGYVLPGQPDRTLPYDIERAAILLVKADYFSRDRDPAVRSEEVVGVGATSYGLTGIDRGFSLPSEVEGLLSRYRAVSV